MALKKRSSNDLVRLGEGLRKIREQSNLTQDEVADYCDIGVSTLYRIESGRISPTIEMLIKFSKITNTPMAKIISLATGENFPWFLEQYQLLYPDNKKIVDTTLRTLIQSLQK